MWGDKKPDAPARPPLAQQPRTNATSGGTSISGEAKTMAPLDSSYPASSSGSGTARLGASLHVKGEITGNEDLAIDGSVEGLVQLEDRKLTIGASAKVTADVIAREVVVYGNVKGNLRARDRIEDVYKRQPFGLMLRRSLPETFHASDAGKRERVSLRPYLFVAVIGLVLLASSTIGTYITSYMTTYAIATLHMRANIAFAATVVVGLTGVVFDLVSGALSDKIGRKPMMLIPGVVLLVSILPAFDLISHYRTTPILLGATAVLTTLLVLSSCPIVIWLTESFPTAIRSGSVSVVYALSIALFGGTTQFSVTWLIRRTGNPLAPAWYWTVAAGVSIAAMCATHESAPCKLAKRRIAVQAASLTGPVG